MPKAKKTKKLEPKQTNFVHPEKNLIALGFFSTSGKNEKNDLKVIELKRHNPDGSIKTVKVTIAPVRLYGIPTIADQDKYMAFLKILDKHRKKHGKLKNPITFSSYELLKIQNKTSGGKNYKDVDTWLKLMATTSVISEGSVYLANKKKYASDTFSVFDRVKTVGEELDDGSLADRNYVWLSEWQLNNYNAFYQFPTDYETYKKLRNSTSKILANFLQIWLYATAEHGRFEKRYDELCQLLGLRVYKYLSKIKEKLSPSLDELTSFKYLKKWEIKKTRNKDGFKVIFYHGEKFYEDRQLTTKLLSKETQVLETDKLLEKLTKEFGISLKKAKNLLKNNRKEVKRQVDALKYRQKPKNIAGFLIDAIENSYSLPQEYLDQLMKDKHTASINDCLFCDGSGNRLIKSEMDSLGLQRHCTHDTEIESQFEEQFEILPFND